MSLELVKTTPQHAAGLAEEANHRIANHLAMLAAIMRMRGRSIGTANEAMSGEDVRLLLEEFAGRLEAVGKVHRMLAHGASGAPIDMAEYLTTIAEGLVSSLTTGGETTLRSVFPVTCFLPAEQAAALGLLVGELFTNAVKYAHPAGVAGVIKIEASKRDDGTIAIEVGDDGVGLPDDIDPLQSNSLGFRMIRMLAKQVGASVSFINHGLGLSCVLQLPHAARVQGGYASH